MAPSKWRLGTLVPGSNMELTRWILPLLLSLAALGAGLCFLRSSLRLGRIVVVISIAGLMLWSSPPIAWLASASLERRYPPGNDPPAHADAIVVLSASLIPSYLTQPQTLVDTKTYARIRHAEWLYKNWRAVPILVSGGSLGPRGRRANAADEMAEVLVAHGIPANSIWKERESGSTYESAVLSAALLEERGVRRILLVTEGYHMQRAESCYRKQGLHVTPAPCSYRGLLPLQRLSQFRPSADAVRQNEEAFHEWIGLFWYWVKWRV